MYINTYGHYGVLVFVLQLIGLGFFIAGLVLRYAAESVQGYVDLEALGDRIPEFARYDKLVVNDSAHNTKA